MYNRVKKKWTILIYADGNNEMEEVIYKSLLACEKIGSSNDINIVVEISKLGNYRTDEKNSWSGVRRYYVENGHSILIEDLGKTNTADPNNLYDFIQWGYENYKAEQFILVLSDHGGDFIGCFTDLSLKVPYIMGIPEMIQAINAIRTNLGYIIDVLVLDMCYMNCIEIIYELGQDKNATVKSVITYMDSAAYEGLNYEKLVISANEYSDLKDLKLFIKDLIDNQDFNMIAYEINHDKLEQVKLLFSEIGKKTERPLDMFKDQTENMEPVGLIKSINELLESLVIYSKKHFKGINSSISITSRDVGHLIFFYKKLAFSKNNFWVTLLNNTNKYNVFLQKDKVNVYSPITSESKIHYILKFSRS
jgi:Clostripain family.